MSVDVIPPRDGVAWPASPSRVPGDASSTRVGYEGTAVPEVQPSMKHTQPPLLAVVETGPAETPAPSLWRQEAEAAVRGSELAREVALTLPERSAFRARLLERADELTML